MRRARWSHFITVGATALAAVAAIGGLWAQAVTTFWSQQTAKDQLRQSQEDQEKEERAQAMAVSLWVDRADDTDDTSWRLHILNRSPDPVPFMQAAYLIRVGGGGSARALAVSGPANAYLVVNTSRLAPCTELVFSSKQTGRDWGSPKGEVPLPPPGSRLHFDQFAFAYFVDRDGRSWLRWGQGQFAPFDTENWRRITAPSEEILWEKQTKGDPVTRPAASCGGTD
ncbi:hypothetical protein [Streptomyces sp. NPDC006446]|uniref:hypothetical protein n=1 Tax=Streptomyces sp. NPDC006446 TaxID=3154301 RepID=UPI0033A98066